MADEPTPPEQGQNPEDQPAAEPQGGGDDDAMAQANAGGPNAAEDMAEQALAAAAQAVQSLQSEDQPAGDSAESESDQALSGANIDLPNFQQVLADVEASGINLLHDVDLHVKIELGRTDMLVEDVLKLNEGSVVELDKLAGDPVDVYVNDRLVARGEVLVLNDCFCVRVSEILSDSEQEDQEENEPDSAGEPASSEQVVEKPQEQASDPASQETAGASANPEQKPEE
jgi:flagellar motor switch protein FliN/FliY